MHEIKLTELIGGAVQEKFSKSLNRVLENMLDINTPFKAKRSIIIKISFDQNELRNDIKAHIDVSEKLAPEGALETSFAYGRNLKTGEIELEEYGKQIKGQMSLTDYSKPELEDIGDGRQVNTETGEITGKVVDLRKAL